MEKLLRPITLVLPSHFPDFFQSFNRNAQEFFPDIPKILIRDGNLFPDPEGWTTIQGPSPFCLSQYENIGWNAAYPNDVILAGDDVRILTPNFLEIFQEAAYSRDDIAVLTPTIIESPEQSPFVFGYFKRSVIDQIGPMDERFNSYGYDDNDFLTRCQMAGLYQTRTSKVSISHPTTSTTFFRKANSSENEPVQDGADRMRRLFAEKWPNPISLIWKTV